MYRVFNGKSWLEFENYIQLVNWVSQYNTHKQTNTFLDQVGINENDTYAVSYYIGDTFKHEFHPRIYRVENGDNISIYDNNFRKDVINWKYNNQVYQDWYNWKNSKVKTHKYSRWYIPEKAYPEFRHGPWPNVHHPRGGRYCRPIKVMMEKRAGADPEYEKFYRPGRGKNNPDAWDIEPIRDWSNRGWKRQGKLSHQWEHKVILNTKRYNKNAYVGDFETLDNLDE